MRPAKPFAFLVLSAALVSSTSASAVEAVAITTTIIHTGPNVTFAQVDTLYEGETVDFGQCQVGWCYITHHGPDGWVESGAIANHGGMSGGGMNANSPAPIINLPADPSWSGAPVASFSPPAQSITVPGTTMPQNTFPVTVAPPGSDVPQIAAPMPKTPNALGPSQPAFTAPATTTLKNVVPQVCIYDGYNYEGAGVCYSKTDHRINVTGDYWDNRMSSIKIIGGAKIRICDGPLRKLPIGGSGLCATHSKSIAQLTRLDNKVSSFVVTMPY